MSQPLTTANETRPLTGKKIVVTRARQQASTLLARLEALGAQAIEFPVIQIVAPESFEPMDRAIARLDQFDWVIFTSVNGVEYFWQRLEALGSTSAALTHLNVCAIGPATGAALSQRGITPALVPQKFVAEGILADLGQVAGQRFLLPRAELAREALLEGLEAQGAFVQQVVAYRTVVADEEGTGSTGAPELVRLFEAGEIDLITFTSSSTVRFFGERLAAISATALPVLLSNTVVACIGPITAGTAREMGLTVSLEAPEFTVEHLVQAILGYYGSGRDTANVER
jgi:uroporphyrinogen III methyltransferase/synthase